jgi:hypothetical protein
MLGVWTWFTFWLLLHILVVIVAFGPTFAFPGIAAMARRDPAHAVAYSKVMHFIEERIVIPLAIVVPLFGTALIFAGHFDLWKSEWLVISIVLYIAAFTFAVTMQFQNSKKMVDLLAAMPPGPPPPGAAPPAEIQALGKKLQFGGMYLTISVVVIVILMVWRPGSSFTG